VQLAFLCFYSVAKTSFHMKYFTEMKTVLVKWFHGDWQFN